MSRYVGVDPGASGAIAVVNGAGVLLGTIKLDAQAVDVWAFLSAVDGAMGAVLEKVSSSPQMGVASAFSFGQSYGMVRAFLVAAAVPFEEVTPASWRAAMHCKGTGKSVMGAEHNARRKENKAITKAKAMELFPRAKVTDAIADALLLAEYARRLAAARTPRQTLREMGLMRGGGE